MKKIIALLVAVIFAIPISVKAGSFDSYVDWNLDRSVFAHQYRNGSDHITNLAMMSANGKVAYCIEPGITADKASYYSSTVNINDTTLKNVDVKKLSLIGYYGYGYNGHTSKEYYMAAQELIWRYMGVENVWWTDQKEGGNTFNIEPYKNEIMNLVNNYEVAPNFNFKKSYIVGDEVEVTDTNNVLAGYEVINNDNVSINGNSLKIKVTENNNFTLRRKKNETAPIFYYKQGYQTVGTFEYAYDFSKDYSVPYEYGKIEVSKMDYDTKDNSSSSPEASLEGATYGLYDKDNNLIKTGETNEFGKVIFDGLIRGNYGVKEISPSKGYTIDKTTTKTFIGGSMKTFEVKSYEKIIRNKINIIKVLDNPWKNTCEKEEGVVFGIYNAKGVLIDKYKTDKDGTITLDLPYGTYILKQETSPDGVDKAPDKLIEVFEDGVVQNIVIVNHFSKKEDKVMTSVITSKKTLPNTSKENIFIILKAFSFGLFGLIYEKKFI